MAGESTATTLAALMETITLRVQTNLKNYSELWMAPLYAEVDSGLTVYFPTVAPAHRSLTASAASEGGAVTPTAMVVSGAAATLADYPVLARVSNTSIKGGANVIDTVSQVVGMEVGNTVDKLIYSVGKAGFATSISSSDGFSYGDLMNSVAALRAGGYKGQFVCIADWRALQGTYGLFNDVLAKLAPNTNEEILKGTGYLGMIGGVEIYGTSMADTYTAGSETWAYNLVFDKSALGFANVNPLLDLRSQDAPEYSAAHIYGSCFCGAKLLDASGGKRIETRVA